MDSFLSLLQFADGLFPAGAYAHSLGLEYLIQSGEISSEAGVETFLYAFLKSSVAPTDAVAMLCASRAAKAHDLAQCLSLDEKLDAMKTSSELREASRQMGRQTLRVANQIQANKLLANFAEAVKTDATSGHHPVIFGMIGGAMAWHPQEMAGAYLYSTIAALVGAALRLMPLGQLAGQRILWNVRPLIANLAEEIQGKTESDIWSFAPALEIASIRHAMLDARLFRS
jgi:urease accessory protein